MKLFSKIKKIISAACILFTLLITSIYSLGAFVNSDWLPTPSMLYSLLAFSLTVSILNLFLFSDSLIFALRLIIHYVSAALAFYLLFVVASGYRANGGSVITVMLLFTLVYTVFAVVLMICQSAKKKLKKDRTEYKKMF